MTKKTRVAVLTLLCATLIMQAQAQHEATLHFMKSLPQVSHNNPAFQPRYKFSLGLPPKLPLTTPPPVEGVWKLP